MSVYKKLQQCRVDLQKKEIKKSGHNKFAQYYYMELGDFLPEINRLFHENGLFSQVSYTADTATLTITDVEDMSSVVFTSPMGSAALKGCHEVQNIGAVETYQRRYLYVTALEIVEHDALDASTGKDEKKEPKHGADYEAGKILLEGCGSLAALSKTWETGLTKEQRLMLAVVKEECKKRIADADKVAA